MLFNKEHTANITDIFDNIFLLLVMDSGGKFSATMFKCEIKVVCIGIFLFAFKCSLTSFDAVLALGQLLLREKIEIKIEKTLWPLCFELTSYAVQKEQDANITDIFYNIFLFYTIFY